MANTYTNKYQFYLCMNKAVRPRANNIKKRDRSERICSGLMVDLDLNPITKITLVWLLFPYILVAIWGEIIFKRAFESQTKEDLSAYKVIFFAVSFPDWTCNQ